MTKNLGKLDDLLNKFQKAADDGKYQRIPYTQWKKLKTADKCKAKIVTDENTGERFAQIIRKEDDKIVLEFPVKDQSFGEFLSTEILTGGIDLMPPKDNDTLNQTYAWNNTASSGYYDSYDSKLTYVPYNTASTKSNYVTGGIQTDRTGATSIKISDFDRVYSDRTNASLTDTFITKAELDDALATKEDKKSNNKENDKMKGFNFDFGPCTNNAVKMSLYGLAVKNSTGTWVSYDPKSETIIDVDILNFDGAKYLYKMPVAIKDIAAGDVVVHMGKPMFVVSATTKSLHVVDPISGERKEIMLTRSPFGFDFATKIVNFLGNFMDSAATPDNPFGNMWMLMLAQGENNSDLSNILPFMFMSGGNALNANPMMMYFLLGNKNGNDNLLPLMFMMNNTPAHAPAHTCKCGGECACGNADTNA
jgi:hypothetical protein